MDFKSFRHLVHGPKQAKKDGDRLYKIERNISVRISFLLRKFFPFITANMVSGVSYFFLAAVIVLVVCNTPMNSHIVFGIQLFLLYCVSILDKIDGEVARSAEHCTQKGIYLDRGVHFLYPVVFYVAVGFFFFTLSGSIGWFVITIVVGLLAQMRLFFREAKLLVGDSIVRGKLDIKDYINRDARTMYKQRKTLRLVRIVDYLTFMIYAWTLFMYAGLAIASVWYVDIAYSIYQVHIIGSLIILLYHNLYIDPKWGLYTQSPNN